MRWRLAVFALAAAVGLVGCAPRAAQAPAASPTPTATPSVSASITVPAGQDRADLNGILVTLETSAAPPEKLFGGKLAPGKRWLAVILTAVNTSDATISARVWHNWPLLLDAGGAPLRADQLGTRGLGTVTVDKSAAATHNLEPDGLRPEGLYRASAWYQVADSQGPFTLTWRLGPDRIVQFRLE